VLVLTRRPQQSITIGNDVIVTVLEIKGDSVRIGIQAPPEVEVHRAEVYAQLHDENTAAASPSSEAIAAFLQRVKGNPTPEQGL
jgi:carbon storage regulator